MFKGISRNNNKISDPVVITTVNVVHSNACDPSFVDQFKLTRTRAGDYKRCGGQSLREIMIQMAVEPFVNVRKMKELF